MQHDLFTQDPAILSHSPLFQVHVCESNKESEAILDSGRDTFSKNCEILFKAFMRGDVINSDNSPVREFRRRRQDLSDENGVRLSPHSTSGRLKNWYMSETDKQFNQKFL